jgi:tetratricopeptide (TPR) repeat protein
MASLSKIEVRDWYCRRLAAALILMPLFSMSGLSAQSVEPAASANVQGTVRDADHHPVAGATVWLQSAGESSTPKVHRTHTDAFGFYRFAAIEPGGYTLTAELMGQGRAKLQPLTLAKQTSTTLDLTLVPEPAGESKNQAEQLQFSDDIRFTVAGVTDTTNLGGHGSDTLVRNREAVAEAVASLSKKAPGSPQDVFSADEKSLRNAVLGNSDDFAANYQLGKLLAEAAKPQEAIQFLQRAAILAPGDFDNRYELVLAYARSGDYSHALSAGEELLALPKQSPRQSAELHHLLGDAEEALGQALDAEREYAAAAQLDPNEPILFDWGADLLIHHAAEPAMEVFTDGNRRFPQSLRMLAGLGAAWYAMGSYDRAAESFCAASDLNPVDPTPYLLMGEMQAAESASSPALVERLARFARLQPQNSLANYYYALSLRKRRRSPDDVRNLDQVKSLLEKSVQIDPGLGLAYLELGSLYSERGDLPRAVSAYEHAVQATASLEQAHYRLAQLYRRTGETSKAHSELQLYQTISRKKAQDEDRKHHELQQFVYQLRDRAPVTQSPSAQ